MDLCWGSLSAKTELAAGHSLWAPDINYINGKYVLYYTLGHWDLPKNSCIGVAVSDSPVGPFTDHGKLLDYNSGTISASTLVILKIMVRSIFSGKL